MLTVLLRRVITLTHVLSSVRKRRVLLSPILGHGRGGDGEEACVVVAKLEVVVAVLGEEAGEEAGVGEGEAGLRPRLALHQTAAAKVLQGEEVALRPLL